MTNIEIRVHGAYDQLSNTEKKTADYFLQNMNTVFQMPIAELAKQSGVSQVTWVRFCKALGFDGLKNMKHSLFEELNQTMSGNGKLACYEFTDIKNFSDFDQIIESVRHSNIQAIEDTARLLDVRVLGEIVQKIVAAPSVRLFGVGASGQVAEDFYSKLIRIGKRVYFNRDIHIQLTYAANLAEADVAILISNSGLTKEILELLAVCRKTPATCIALTRFGSNPLAGGCDYALSTSAPEADKRSGAMSSRIAQLTMVDILFTAVANKDYFNVETMLEKSYEVCLDHRMPP